MSFFEQIWIPFTQGYFVPSLVETDWAVLEEKIFKLDNVFLLIPVYLPLEKGVTLNLYKIKSPSPKDALGQVRLKFAQWFLRKLLNFVNVCLLFRVYLPFKKGVTIHLKKFEFPLSKNALCQVWLKLAQQFWRRRFLNFVYVFSLFCNYLPLEKHVALYLKKLESPFPRMLCAKFGWNWLHNSGDF